MERRPRTDDEKARISEGQRRAWAERRRSDDYAAVRAAILALESAPSDFADALALLYYEAAQIAPDVERPRWQRRLDVIAAGRHVMRATLPASFIAGDDLTALEELRRARTPADLTD